MQASIVAFAGTAILVIEGFAVLLLAAGAAHTLVGMLAMIVAGEAASTIHERKWRRFALINLFAIIFALAADVIRTAIVVGWNEIGKLAALAAISLLLTPFTTGELRRLFRVARRSPLDPHRKRLRSSL